MSHSSSEAYPRSFPYVSRLTGVEYLVCPRPGWGSDEANKYTIVLNGNPIQFCSSEEEIESRVQQFEQ